MHQCCTELYYLTYTESLKIKEIPVQKSLACMTQTGLMEGVNRGWMNTDKERTVGDVQNMEILKWHFKQTHKRKGGGGYAIFSRDDNNKNQNKIKKTTTKQGKEVALRACSFILDFQVMDWQL